MKSSVARNVQSARCDALVPAVASAAAFVATLRMKGRREAWVFASKLTKTTLVMLKICAKLWILIFHDLCRARLTWRKAMLQHRPVLLTLTMDSSCLSSLSFLWLLCTLQDTSKYSKLVQEDRMITIEDGRKSCQENKSLKAKMCAKRTGIQPSICWSRSHLVDWHLQAPEMFEDHGCRQFSRDKVYQLAADSNSSNFSCAKEIIHIEYIPTM